jgi:HNH endonuclease
MTEPYVSAALRRLVTARAAACCEYCRGQTKYAAQSFSIDHIIPRQAGGLMQDDNLALACQGCNGHKAMRTMALDPVSGVLTTLFHPRQQRWGEHFRWSEDFTEIIGLTPVGRATVAALHLNRSGLVHMRRILFAAGEHPPVEM